jgi:hypothetical protein
MCGGSSTYRSRLRSPRCAADCGIASVGSNQVLARPDVKAQMETLGFDPIGGTPERLATYLRSEIATWAKVATDPLFLGQ